MTAAAAVLWRLVLRLERRNARLERRIAEVRREISEIDRADVIREGPWLP